MYLARRAVIDTATCHSCQQPCPINDSAKRLRSTRSLEAMPGSAARAPVPIDAFRRRSPACLSSFVRRSDRGCIWIATLDACNGTDLTIRCVPKYPDARRITKLMRSRVRVLRIGARIGGYFNFVTGLGTLHGFGRGRMRTSSVRLDEPVVGADTPGNIFV